jgi:hypothetical protein
VSTVLELVHESFGEHDRGLQNYAVSKSEDVPNGAGHPYLYRFCHNDVMLCLNVDNLLSDPQIHLVTSKEKMLNHNIRAMTKFRAPLGKQVR